MNKADFIAGAVAIALVIMIMSLTGCAINFGKDGKASVEMSPAAQMFTSKSEIVDGDSNAVSPMLEGGAVIEAETTIPVGQ